MKYCVVEGGYVTKLVEFDPKTSTWAPPEGAFLMSAEQADAQNVPCHPSLLPAPLPEVQLPGDTPAETPPVSDDAPTAAAE